MLISIRTHLLYTTPRPCDVLLQIEAAREDTQICHEAKLEMSAESDSRIIGDDEGIGTRRWLRAGATFDCVYEALIEVTRETHDLEGLNATLRIDTPADVTKYLMPSRYCHPEAFFEFVPQMFGHLNGGAMVAAMSNWIKANFTYDNGISHAATTAGESFANRAGVCRDYAHVLIAMVRAAGLPARFVSGYGPNVTPQDFHAVAEVFLDGCWYLVDPTGMSRPPDFVRIGVGRDAADVSFMTSYGWMELKKQSVEVAMKT